MFRLHHFRKSTIMHLLAFIVCLLCSLLLIDTPSSAANAHTRSLQWRWAGQTPHKTVSPEEVTRQFYHWYLSAGFPNPKRSNMATFRKYVTQSFLKRATAPDVEAVLFIDAQDTDPSWADNYTVSTASIHGQSATLQVDLNGKEMKHTLKISLRRAAGVWKINDVKGTD